jgi:hypothetical protein
MKIKNDTDYCRLCYKKQPDLQPNGEPNNAESKRAACKQTYLGCTVCKEPICKWCWPSYDHGISL